MTSEPSTLVEDRLRIFLIDRLCAPILHNMRNALQGIMGHAALLRIPLNDRTAATDLSKKLQTAAEQCNARIEALSAVLSLTRHRGLSARLSSFLSSLEPLLQDVMKGHHILRVQTDNTLERARIMQQPLSQLLLMLCICSTDLGEKGRTILIELATAPHRESRAALAEATEPPAIFVRLCDAQAHWPQQHVDQLVNPTLTPPADAVLYPYWLTGCLLREAQAAAEIVHTEAGSIVQARWASAAKTPLAHK